MGIGEDGYLLEKGMEYDVRREKGMEWNPSMIGIREEEGTTTATCVGRERYRRGSC